MKTTLAVLKYLPLLLCCLLATAWLISPFYRVGMMHGHMAFDFNEGSIRIWHNRATGPAHFRRLHWVRQTESLLGKFEYARIDDIPYEGVRCPIPFVLTFLVPLAIGCLNRFRFALWMWFAWSALLALECAYYLR